MGQKSPGTAGSQLIEDSIQNVLFAVDACCCGSALLCRSEPGRELLPLRVGQLSCAGLALGLFAGFFLLAYLSSTRHPHFEYLLLY